MCAYMRCEGTLDTKNHMCLAQEIAGSTQLQLDHGRQHPVYSILQFLWDQCDEEI